MYKVVITRKAEKGYNKLIEYREQINRVLDLLETVPYPSKEYSLKKLCGSDAYRIRVGKVRIKYFIVKEKKEIVVYNIELRSDSTYKRG